MDSQTKRTRRCASKSRNGCARCKVRRVKCDEARPTCSNCDKLGASCPGYQQQLRWCTKYQRPKMILEIESNNRSTKKVMNDPRGSVIEDRHAHAHDMRSPSCTTRMPACSAAFESTSIDDHRLPNRDLPDLNCDNFGSIPNSSTTTTTTEKQTLNPDPAPTITEPTLGIVAPPTHMSTILIEYWFGWVCPLRSTFDSGINYNRQVAWSTWSSSEPVFSTMQAMSAACLVGSMPQLQETLPLLRCQALTAVSLGLTRVQASSASTDTVELIFAMLSLGTSLHWSAPASLSDSESLRWESARDLLLLWGTRLEATDVLLHAYFSQALTYWDMLLAPVGRGSHPAKIRTRREQLKKRLVNMLSLSMGNGHENGTDHLLAEDLPDVLGTRPNSWCGISSEVINTYGQVLALCRSVSSVASENIDTPATERAIGVLCNMSIARDLQRQLLAVDFDLVIFLEEAQGYPVVTQDRQTPVSHLLQTAEAFRKAALLQLHLGFEDLPILPTMHACNSLDQGANSVHHQSRDEYIRKMAFDLATTLEAIPIESGSKSIHAMLYLAVTVGLCKTTHLESQNIGQADHDLEEYFGIYNMVNTTEQACCVVPSSQDVAPGEQLTVVADHQPQSLELAILKTRRMTLTRLRQLQQMLPHASSSQVLQVTEAIWSAYDSPHVNNSKICWFQIAREIALDDMLWL